MPYARPKLSSLRDVNATGRADGKVLAWDADLGWHAYIAITPALIGAAETVHTHSQGDITGLSAALSAKADDSDLTAHTGNTSNPHSVTKSQVGLGNVTNDAQLKAASNLSDLADAGTARGNLGLGDLATQNSVTKSQVSDLETITATPTASTVPKASGSGKIDNGWLNTGSGNGLDADKLDSYEASAFPRLAASNTFTTTNKIGSTAGDQVTITPGNSGSTPQILSENSGGFNLALKNTGTGGRTYYLGATNDTYSSGGGKLILTDNTASSGSASLTLSAGKFGLGVGNTNPTAVVDVLGDTIRLRTSRTPASASATGNAGDICWDSSYLYICTATNTWKRVAISSW